MIDPSTAALAGVVLGVVLKAGFDTLLERRRWRREEKVRWLEEKRRAYAAFLSATRELEDLAKKGHALLAANGMQPAMPITGIETYPAGDPRREALEVWSRYLAALDRVQSAIDELDVISPEPVGIAARQFAQMASLARENSSSISGRATFLIAIRKDLGIETDGPLELGR